jgi:O-antigen/teichoic acid export membrane protein
MSFLKLKNKTIKGLLWSSVDKLGALVIGFLVGLILARKLTPADYGLIGMLTIFTSVSNLLIESGFSSALIQKQSPSQNDYATVFYFNLLAGIIIYLLLFFFAPYIAIFFDNPILVKITRVLSLMIIVNSFSLVPQTQLTIKLDFKTQANISVWALGMGGIIAVIAAYNGLGVWALVIQLLSASVIKMLLLFYYNKYLPRFVFDVSSFKNLFKFSSNILAAGLSSTIVNNIYSTFIGRCFKAKDLGYYTTAKLYPEYLDGPIGNIITSVGYPVLSSLKDNKKVLIQVYARLIRVTSFFVLPALTLFAILCEPFIRLILKEKWMPAVSLIQWMCFARLLAPLSSLNMLTLNVIGKSKLFLRIEILKLPITIIALVISIPLGLKAIVIGHFITMLVSYFLTTYYPSKFFEYGAFRQLKDITTVIIATILMAVAVIGLIHIIKGDFLKLILGSLSGLIVYLTAAFIMKIEELNDIKTLSQSFLK